ncbi:MAG: O-methyltransferase [Bacteroidales bacterium]|jgi:predicted O-methyltransferase YrrM|nr:O-methyltransferase [Bacteroidales bacterium]MDD4213648.1 O-methyltransferase [Bacteroidales bacterium]
MNLTEDKITTYAEMISSPEGRVLSRLRRETHLKAMNPIMLTGHIQGSLLRMLTSMIKPRLVLEIGTYTGYSAICMAQGLNENGKIITIEINPELENICRKYFAESEMNDKINLIIGDALTVIPTLEQKFDMVYIDCDKSDYLNVYNLAMEKLNSGGYIFADNVLWHGKIFASDDKNNKGTKAIKLFNRYIKNDVRVQNLLLPMRDGLMLIQKL